MRVRCWLLGCKAPYEVGYPVPCDRCGQDNDSGWHHEGIARRIRRKVREWHRLLCPRCWHCGKRLNPLTRHRRKWSDFCGKECGKEWIPF